MPAAGRVDTSCDRRFRLVEQTWKARCGPSR